MKVHLGRFPKGDKERKISVKIDFWDTWSADHSIALIAHPLLIKLKEDKQGAPFVDDEDVPDDLKSTSAPPKENDYDVDANHFKRWDWVLNQMIYSMQQISTNKPDEDQFYDHSKVDDNADLRTQVEQMQIDREGLEVYNNRIQNGCRLFGKYFQCLWS